jgi:hypothetical protein
LEGLFLSGSKKGKKERKVQKRTFCPFFALFASLAKKDLTRLLNLPNSAAANIIQVEAPDYHSSITITNNKELFPMRFSPSLRHRLLPISVLILSIFPALPAQQKQAQQMDEDFAKSVKEWTTRPEFISPLVDHLPKVAGVPSPKDALGYHIGTPRKLTRTTEIYKYYRELASRSSRVKVINIGQTDEGRECLVVIVANEETVKNIDTYRGYLTQLGDPRQITEAQAQEIIEKAKPSYHLMGGLHSAETGPPEMLMELTYRLVLEDSPIINAVRDNIIVTITPVVEPDGRDRYVVNSRQFTTNYTKEDTKITERFVIFVSSFV